MSANINNDAELDVASERLDSLRREIARRVVTCHRDAIEPENDERLKQLRAEASQLLTDISHFELFGTQPPV